MRPLAKWALVGCGVFLLLYAVRLIGSEAPPTPPHDQSQTASEPAHPIPAPDPHHAMPPALFAYTLELAKRAAAKNPENGMPPITNAEARDTKEALWNIPERTPAFRTAQELLALLRRREAEGERAMAAYIAKEATENRKDDAAAIERLLLEHGMDAAVTASGPGTTTLTIRYKLMSRPLVNKVLNDTDFLANRRAEGFRRAIFTDGYERSWLFDLTK
jgi:hypothetical protein